MLAVYTTAIGRERRERVIDLFSSGRPVMEILEAYDAMLREEAPANENGPNWVAIRDHSPGDLDGWLDGVDTPIRTPGPSMPRLVASRDD